MQTPLIEQTYASLPQVLYAKVELNPVTAPKLLIGNVKLAREVGIDPAWLETENAAQLLSGNAAATHGAPLAMAYAGHQYGGFNPSLGDGRAMLLGDVVLPDGTRRELHLKGSGRTHFSRGADGRATISAMLREYIVSEAMAALGVPTTRSLAVMATGERVWRQRPEEGAVLTRVATSHVRVGTFQYLAARSEIETIRILMHHEIARHMPGVEGAQEFLAEIIKRQASLIAMWMSFGFIHGVMNTDNMQIAGETIDYGPCAFMDAFHPQKVFSSIDENGRYAYDKQPTIALWNLTRLAECLLPLLDEDRADAIELAEAELQNFMPQFEEAFEQRMLAKLGIEDLAQGDFIATTLQHMANVRDDFTQFFTSLTRSENMESFFISKLACDEWLAKLKSLQSSRADELMKAHNPVYIARNHRVAEALAAAEQGDLGPLHVLLEVITKPFQTCEEFNHFEQAPLPQEEVLQTFCGT
jgi:serine/tyrosine/threonine adenylyltransferase